ncbi:MAG TPA: 3-carboxy-cis,cis-muconate cycloisomerase [Rhodobacteraceae bacterium]|jgi:3-carboxy-cis,cis-muconate cycloisomerase|nr:3-carboxy-cis,cis-muconate cycloisomerase [Paracoccaceae bacterium]
MASTLLDSHFYRDQYSSAQMRAVFSDEARFSSWLEAEIALARAQARVGIIPQEAADKIATAAILENINLEEMKAEFDRVGFAIMPLVHQIAKACDKETARYIHWGSTTQDILDIGLVLQMRAGFDLIEDDIEAIIRALATLCHDHRDTVMAGRTFMQQAAPITFGYKAGVWLDEMMRHRDRLDELRARLLVVQCGGAVGTLATLGENALPVRRELAAELGLSEPDISWHTARDTWAEAIFWLGIVTATLGKIATEIATLMRSEVGEVREPYQPGRGASSTMPQKRNPISCPPIIAIAQRMREMVGSQMSAMIQEHERGVGAMPVEWMVVPEAFLLASGSLMHSRANLEGLDVDAKKMRANLEGGGGLIMAEAVMMGLAPHIGRNRAHEEVYAAAGRAIEAGTTLREQLRDQAEINAHLSPEEVDELLNPGNYTGAAGEMTDRVLAQAKEKGFI